MRLRIYALELAVGLAVGCSEPNDPEPVPAAPTPATSEATGEAPEADPEPAAAEVVPERTLRILVLGPEPLPTAEQEMVDSVLQSFRRQEIPLAIEPASEAERTAVTALLSDEGGQVPEEWSRYETVLAMTFEAPDMIGRREPRPFSLGLRGALVWHRGDEEPMYIERNGLRHGRHSPVGDLSPRGQALLVSLVASARGEQ